MRSTALKCINEHEFFTDGAIEHHHIHIEVNPIGHVGKHQRSCLYRHTHINRAYKGHDSKVMKSCIYSCVFGK